MPMRDCKRHEAAKVNEIGEGICFCGQVESCFEECVELFEDGLMEISIRVLVDADAGTD